MVPLHSLRFLQLPPAFLQAFDWLWAEDLQQTTPPRLAPDAQSITPEETPPPWLHKALVLQTPPEVIHADFLLAVVCLQQTTPPRLAPDAQSIAPNDLPPPLLQRASVLQSPPAVAHFALLGAFDALGFGFGLVFVAAFGLQQTIPPRFAPDAQSSVPAEIPPPWLHRASVLHVPPEVAHLAVAAFNCVFVFS